MPRKQLSDEMVFAKRDALVTTAMRILEAEGNLDAITLRKVAAEHGCSYATPYRYFDSKESLIVAMRAKAFRWMESKLASSVDKTKSTVENLSMISQAYISAGLGRPELYQLMFFDVAVNTDKELEQQLDEAKAECLDVCTQVVRSAIESQELDTEIDPLSASHIFWASAHGLVSLEISRQLVMGRDLKFLTQLVLDIVVSGIQNANIRDSFTDAIKSDGPVLRAGGI